ncbi:MAG: DNA-directed RNA polymerase subunit L [Hadesarchaea archaeon]|nr:DNA-directed RNA polymerase subunit L [Hadesarchaea archaeon]
MELEETEKEGTTMKIRVIGEGHTFCNALRAKLHEDDRVETAAYNIEHPLLAHPEMHVTVQESRSPRRAYTRAAKAIADDYSEFREKLQKALEK